MNSNEMNIGAVADTPWNTHELTVADPDGNRFTFTARAAGPTQGFEETMERAKDGA